MRHVAAIAGREFRSFFWTPVAYVVLAMWALLGATFFLASVIAFDSEIARLQQFGAAEQLAMLNLNDHLIASFLFVLLRAPDVAMAEASIGSALTAIILVLAIRKTSRFEEGGGEK